MNIQNHPVVSLAGLILSAASVLIAALMISANARALSTNAAQSASLRSWAEENSLDVVYSSQAPAKACANRPESRQFDFWVGEWEVRNPKGQLAGTNSVQLILGDCVIAENWTGARGNSGKSFNFYDAGTGKWHQLWVDDRGGVLRLAGEYRDGAMRFEGETPKGDGKKTLERLTFTALPDGRVRQFWEQSVDDGKTWSVAFDGTYTKK